MSLVSISSQAATSVPRSSAGTTTKISLPLPDAFILVGTLNFFKSALTSSGWPRSPVSSDKGAWKALLAKSLRMVGGTESLFLLPEDSLGVGILLRASGES